MRRQLLAVLFLAAVAGRAEDELPSVFVAPLDGDLSQVQGWQPALGEGLAEMLITELNKQLDVQTKVLDAQGQFTGLIPVSAREPAPADLARQIDQHFGTASTTQGAVAAERVANLGTH